MDAKRFVEYRGIRMIEGWPERIQAAQAMPRVLIRGQLYDRVRFGSEADDWGADNHPCADCRVNKDEVHVDGCDGEECPRCHEQLITCDCEPEYSS
jgi:hypothetical protein